MKSRVLIQLFLIFGLSFGINSAFAQQSQKGFLSLATGHALYFEYIKATPGQPTLVLLNGLTYETTSWNTFTKAVYSPGMGILRYDPVGMGKTLLKYAPIVAPISLRSQVEDLKLLLDGLGIHQRVNLLGLSYGGALAIFFTAEYPGLVQNCILMAPFVAPIKGIDDTIKQQIATTRILFPLNPATDDQLYAYFFRNIAYATYPTAEPSVLKNPYKMEAVIEMALGSRNFLASKVANALGSSRVHLIIAQKDQYIPTAVHQEFWKQVPSTARESVMYLDQSEHKIPEAFPKFSAAWVRLIVANDARLSRGDVFEGNPALGLAKSAHTQITMPKEH